MFLDLSLFIIASQNLTTNVINVDTVTFNSPSYFPTIIGQDGSQTALFFKAEQAPAATKKK